MIDCDNAISPQTSEHIDNDHDIIIETYYLYIALFSRPKTDNAPIIIDSINPDVNDSHVFKQLITCYVIEIIQRRGSECSYYFQPYC